MTPEMIKVAEVELDGKMRSIFTGALGSYCFIVDSDDPGAGLKVGDRQPVVLLGDKLAAAEAIKAEFIGPKYLPSYLR